MLLRYSFLSFTAYRIVDGVHKPEDLCAGEVLGDNEFCKREFLFLDRIIRGGEGEDQICEDQPYNSKLFVSPCFLSVELPLLHKENSHVTNVRSNVRSEFDHLCIIIMLYVCSVVGHKML